MEKDSNPKISWNLPLALIYLAACISATLSFADLLGTTVLQQSLSLNSLLVFVVSLITALALYFGRKNEVLLLVAFWLCNFFVSLTLFGVAQIHRFLELIHIASLWGIASLVILFILMIGLEKKL